MQSVTGSAYYKAPYDGGEYPAVVTVEQPMCMEGN